jgi:hypothetical protein
LADKRLGLLINFNAALIKDGINPHRQRVWNKAFTQSRKDPKTKPVKLWVFFLVV